MTNNLKLIKFEQESCVPCTLLKNYLQHELEVEVDETVNLTLDGDNALELAGIYGIMKTPTLVLIDDMGVVVDSFGGIDREGVNSIVAKRGLI